MTRGQAQFYGGIGLALLAAVLMLATEAALPAAITLLIVGIGSIATSRRDRT